MHTSLRSRLALTVAVTLCAFALLGCGGTSAAADAGPAGGPVAGAADMHCMDTDGGQILQAVDAASCTDSSTGAAADYGDTNYNAKAADDDCKYDVNMTVTPIRENAAVTFVVKVVKRTDGVTPVTGAGTRVEAFLNDTHPAPNPPTPTTTTEAPAGTYTIGPVVFDASGRWTARFHFFESCADEPQSPHGHAAFYLDVP